MDTARFGRQDGKNVGSGLILLPSSLYQLLNHSLIVCGAAGPAPHTFWECTLELFLSFPEPVLLTLCYCPL